MTRSNINTASSRRVLADHQAITSMLSLSLKGEKNNCIFLQKFVVMTATGNMHHLSGGSHHLFFFNRLFDFIPLI